MAFPREPFTPVLTRRIVNDVLYSTSGVGEEVSDLCLRSSRVGWRMHFLQELIFPIAGCSPSIPATVTTFPILKPPEVVDPIGKKQANVAYTYIR